MGKDYVPKTLNPVLSYYQLYTVSTINCQLLTKQVFSLLQNQHKLFHNPLVYQYLTNSHRIL